MKVPVGIRSQFEIFMGFFPQKGIFTFYELDLLMADLHLYELDLLSL